VRNVCGLIVLATADSTNDTTFKAGDITIVIGDVLHRHATPSDQVLKQEHAWQYNRLSAERSCKKALTAQQVVRACRRNLETDYGANSAGSGLFNITFTGAGGPKET
jgi:hypothetical protein